MSMEWLRELEPVLDELTPLLLTLAVVAGSLTAVRLMARSRERRQGVPSVSAQVVLLALTIVGIAAIVIALPVSDSLRGRLLGLLGLAFTGVIAFSSTTFVSNVMAGLMLRAVGNFRLGDWLRVGDQFGRVTERGLFHTEIQTEDRDLATLPNLYLVTQPVKVVRGSGTIVSVELSLGYDLDHGRIETLLLRAAREAGLVDAFVRILHLGDFAVTYAVSGFLADVKNLLSVRSRLCACVLDTLHGADVEIVSPTFMNQRPQGPDARAIPQSPSRRPPRREPTPEERIFDKADRKASIEALRDELVRLRDEVDDLQKSDAAERDEAVDERERRIEAVTAELARREAADRADPAD